MPTALYPIFYIMAVIGLIFWHRYQNDEAKSRWARWLFVVGFFGYVATLVLSGVSIDTKLFVGARDMIVLALVNWFFQFLRPSTQLFWSILVFGFALFQLFAVPRMQYGLAAKNDPISKKEIAVDAQGEWLVELAASTDLAPFKRQLKGIAVVRRAFYPSDVNATALDDYWIVDVLDDSALSRKRVGEHLKKMPFVNWVEANEVIQLKPLVAGADFAQAERDYGVDDPETSKQWAMAAFDMKAYFAFLRKQKIKPKKKAKLAILDTGVDAQHEDLKTNFVSIEAKSDNDPVGHGTHCAGIAGAVTNNGIGIASFNEGNQFYSITSVKVLNANGMGTQERIIDGILKAADKGVDVISMSLGGIATQRKQRAYAKAIQYANKKGAIVIVAAGNDNRNAMTTTPANVDGVIAVSAVDSTLTRALFSNYVNDVEMALAAPGVAIYSTTPDNQYQIFNGTSMAAPYVAGLVAIMKALNPKLTTTEVYDILNKTGKKTRNPAETGRFVQPTQALKAMR